MGFWSRKSEDPLLKIFLEKYGLNLLSTPRENVNVGDLYLYGSNQSAVMFPGSITNFLVPEFTIPQITENETLADVSGQVSKDVSGKAALDFVQGFLSALGSIGIAGQIRGSYEKSKNANMLFSFPNTKRDYTDPFLLASKLKTHKFDIENALYKKDNHYYIVTSVVKSNSISVEIKANDEQSSDIDIELTKIIDASGSLKFEKNQAGKITYSGSKELAFGVEVYELQFNPNDGKISMSPSDSSIRARGPNDLIGDPEGDAFIEIVSQT
jgi:hypothetical protein